MLKQKAKYFLKSKIENVFNKSVFLLIMATGFCIFLATEVHAKQGGVNRIQGSNRYATAVEISKTGWGTSEKKGQVAILASGENYPDGLSAGPLAKKYDAPILLTGRTTLDNETKKELIRLHVSMVLIVGGSGVISEDVKIEILSMGMSVMRYWGDDRYETSIEIAKAITSGNFLGYNAKGFILTVGDDFPDALSAAPVAAINQMPIILIPRRGTVPQNTMEYLKSKKLPLYVMGGDETIDEGVLNQLKELKLDGIKYETISGSDVYQRNLEIINKFKNTLDFQNMYISTSKLFPDALAGSALAAKNMSPIILMESGLTDDTKKFMRGNYSKDSVANIFGGSVALSELELDNALVLDSKKNNKKD